MAYYLPQPVSLADLTLMRRIDELHLEHTFMGARMLHDRLARQGIRAGRRLIRTLMLRMGIEALAPQPGTSKATPGHNVYPYLLRKLAITRANQVWALDTTYIPMQVAVRLVQEAGFEPVPVGGLARAKDFDWGMPIFGKPVTAAEAREILGVK